MALILDGRELADRIRAKVKERIENQKLDLGLAVILVGDDSASHLYVGLKQKACEQAGIRFEMNLYPEDEPETNLIAKIIELNTRKDVTGILVQLPLPSQNADHVIAAIDPNKDVDGFHPENLRRLEAGEPGIAPALELGIMKLVDEARKAGGRASNASIIGSQLFARPLEHLLKEQNIVSERLDQNDPNLAEKTRLSDLLIVAIGKPRFITADMIKEGATIIDVGTTREENQVIGDVDPSADKKAGAMTPVPGGVGPMTVAMLLMNVLKAHQLQTLHRA